MLYKLKTILIGILIAVTGCSININTKDLNVVPLETDIPKQSAVIDNYHEFWSAIQHFDFDYINRYEVSDIEQNFVRGLELVMDGNYEDAEELYLTLFQSSDDSLFKENVAEILQSLLAYHSDWEALIMLDSQLPNGLDDQNTIGFARAFQKTDAERYHFPDNIVELPIELSISGVPMVEVLVNGKKQKFWIDTGAEMSVLSSDFAEFCGVENLSEDKIVLGTSTEHTVESWPGIIKELRIGDLTVNNHPVIIIDKKNLEFKLFKIIRLLKIDGIIGWNAIRNLHMEIDYKNGSTTIKKPEKDFNPEPNFHYAGVPFLSLTDTLGIPFHFFFDTGANKTSLYEPALIKVDTTEISHNRAIVGGAGGTQKIKQIVIPEVSLVLGNHRLNFGSMDIHGDGKHDFFYYDGVLGSDIAKFGTLILDFQNGRCELILPESD